MDYTILAETLRVFPDLELDPASLYAVFAEIPDGRDRRGKRYSLALLLSLIVLAKLAGETTLSGVAQWTRLRAQWLCRS